MKLHRRLIIKGALAFLALTGLPKALFAGTWPQKAFASKVANEALINLLGTDQTTRSDKITLVTPLVAEDGSVVPVSVRTSLPNPLSISIVVENNPRPLVVSFDLAPEAIPEIAFRIKMAKTSRVLAVVVTDQGIFSTSSEVKVTIGGC